VSTFDMLRIVQARRHAAIERARDALIAAALDAFDGDGPLPVKLTDAIAAYRKATEARDG